MEAVDILPFLLSIICFIRIHTVLVSSIFSASSLALFPQISYSSASFSVLVRTGLSLVIFHVLQRLFDTLFISLKRKSTPRRKVSKLSKKTKSIQIFHNGGESPRADIVAVHGLASNSETTWNSKNEEADPPQWLRDFLPGENLNARIMAFNYNSKWKGHALSKSLEDHGNDLMLALDGIRQTLEEKNRPIIFIGHSFGGIVIKQAVFNAHIQRDAENFRQQITKMAKGFIFLGTPHKGSKLTFIGKLIAWLYFWKGSSTTLLDTITPGSTSNEQIHATFVKRYSMEKMVVCFFEAVKIYVWGFPLVHVVTKDSARIEGAEFFGFEAHHQSLQRFSSADDPDYEKLVNFLRRYISQVPDISAPNLPGNAQFPGRNNNFVGRERDDQFSVMYSYMLGGGKFLRLNSCLVYGAGGHGKTQFALEYAYRYKQFYECIFWVEAESDIVLLSSFARIGRDLDLFGDETIGQVQKEKVLKWLKSTSRKWLIVFDNVVNHNDIKSYWPSSSIAASSIIATSQISGNWTDHSIKIDPLDDKNGSHFLLSQLHNHNLPLDSPERRHAESISNMLGGSPLWLSQATALINYSKSSLEEFLDNLNTSSNALEENDIPSDWNYGKPALATFDTVLGTLSDEAKDLLFMIAFLSPERIEENLLLASFRSKNLAFLGSGQKYKFARMVGALNQRNLVSRENVKFLTESNKSTIEKPVFLTTHRSIQEGLLHKLNQTPKIRQIAFDRVIDLLTEHCPPPLKTLQAVEADWPVIQSLLPHLLALLQAFERSQPPIEGIFRFATLLTHMGGMNLFDHGFTIQVQILLKSAVRILDQLDVADDHPIRSDIGTVLGLNSDNLGISKRAEGLELRRKTLAIRQKHHSKLSAQDVTMDDEILLFNAETDLACSLQHLNRFREVEEICERCLIQYKLWGGEREVPYEYAKYYNHLAYVLLYENKIAEAVEAAERGSDLMAVAQPGSQMAVTFVFDWATILFQAGGTSRAITVHRDLLEKRISGCGGSDIMTLQSHIHLGIMYFLVEEFTESKEWLQGSLNLASEIDAPSENMARVKYYLAQVMFRQDPHDAEAKVLDRDAKELLGKLLALDGTDSMKEFIAAKDYPILFDYIVSWESRLSTPRRVAPREMKSISRLI